MTADSAPAACERERCAQHPVHHATGAPPLEERTETLGKIVVHDAPGVRSTAGPSVDRRTAVADFELVAVGTDPLRATIRASGALDLSARDCLAEVLGRQRAAGRILVRLELTGVTFMDCSCLRVLLEEHQHFLDARGQLVLTGVRPRMLRLLELTSLDHVLFAVAGPPGVEALVGNGY